MNGRPLVVLPEKTVFVEQVELSLAEREQYELARREGRDTIGRSAPEWTSTTIMRLFCCRRTALNRLCFWLCRYVAEGTVMTNYADVLSILMRLRQHCCHPDLLGKVSDNPGMSYHLIAFIHLS